MFRKLTLGLAVAACLAFCVTEIQAQCVGCGGSTPIYSTPISSNAVYGSQVVYAQPMVSYASPSCCGQMTAMPQQTYTVASPVMSNCGGCGVVSQPVMMGCNTGCNTACNTGCYQRMPVMNRCYRSCGNVVSSCGNVVSGCGSCGMVGSPCGVAGSPCGTVGSPCGAAPMGTTIDGQVTPAATGEGVEAMPPAPVETNEEKSPAPDATETAGEAN